MSVNCKNGLQVIEDFLQYWGRGGKMHYKAIAKTVEITCGNFLRNSAIQYQIKCRAKSRERLEEKLKRRLEEDPGRYLVPKDIEEDIVDLAGVRIALYYPKHQKNIAEFLASEYDIRETVPHQGIHSDGEDDYQKRFRGYQATHFRVRALPGTQLFEKFPTDMLEIQVMSVFQQVWADVEHDILYKQLEGRPSLDERRMLDGLNGLVSMGDLHLEQLHHTYQSRITSNKNKMNRFENEFEVGVVLSSYISSLKANVTTGPVAILFRFLKLPSIEQDTPEKLGTLLKSLPNGFTLLMPDLDPNVTNASAVVMHHTLSNLPQSSMKELNERFRPDTYSECCRVLISTIILLDELFPPLTVWEPQLTNCALESEGRDPRLASLEWLMGDTAPRMAIMGEYELNMEEESYVNTSWAWFSRHPSPMVQFVFGAAKIGLIRDSHYDISTLDRIWRVIQPILFPE